MAQVILGLTMQTGMTSSFCMLHTIIEYVLERDIATTKGLLLNELTGTNAAMECHLDVLNVAIVCPEKCLKIFVISCGRSSKLIIHISTILFRSKSRSQLH
eukprot:g46106.t1